MSLFGCCVPLFSMRQVSNLCTYLSITELNSGWEENLNERHDGIKCLWAEIRRLYKLQLIKETEKLLVCVVHLSVKCGTIAFI